MKTYLMALVLTLTTQTFAQSHCAFLGETSTDIEDHIEAGEFIRVSEKVLIEGGVEFDLREQKLAIKALSYTEDRDLNALGWDYIISEYSLPRSSDELHILTFRTGMSGKTYDYVWSYPGDNEYGVIFDDQAQAIATIGDGDLYCL